MPDLPTPQDATEAALFSECWDTVLSYADLCTAGSAAATQLAREAFAHGIREARTAESETHRNAGRRPPRLPRIALLLTAVRTTAADWETQGHGHRLDPELRLWLNSDHAARYTGPPLRRPLALRALRDMQGADAELLWLAEVEALPLPVVARRLGLDPAGVADELTEVRGLFRDRCLRNHLDTPMDPQCRSYARLLDAVTRSPVADTPDDLSQHLARCVQCAEAAACLRLHGGGLPGALAGGVIGWGGLAYLERRRRAAEVRLGAGRPDGLDPDDEAGADRARVLRGGLLVAAVLVSLLALAVTLLPQGSTGDGAAGPADTADRQPVADPRPSPPVATRSPSESASPSPNSPEPSDKQTPAPPSDHKGTDPEPQGSSTTSTQTGPSPGEGEQPTCHVTYDLVSQWPDGFQAAVTVTTEHALDDWRVAWTFRDGQRVGQMWDASFTQDGSRVTATAADYNKAVPADGSLAFGFLASWRGKNSPAYDFTLNGQDCAKA
ncbi:cellulose-binding domain-containing protein [Streptomyces sp. TRM72054]|uniref:cellulose-binding domain-containing protein n=1 Tax=Streptomyces sp. TRM72054 TaxID=2870562 RepID=UPI001C8C50A7|nr:cellulose-binding domain-containing protein [Streptomyces sp. TRM72054]MBX9393866.1 cellulose-binding domain-containing protein [Streptomyces sp. TRM72054]